MQQIKLLTVSTAIAAVMATGAMAGGSSVATGPTIPPQGTTATTTGGSTASALTSSYNGQTQETTERRGCVGSLFCNSGPPMPRERR